ncbi:MAG: DEAD/DEAH box helicase [Fusobacterium sp.]|uniref:DEAD/DEAH box helicase n=1 Tax=Fusobacterium sp. TaxID=68766 RepID=UPI0026DC9F39|nr:DEAD/DEAH box helicase [Fusobacterium sp.]MDO4689674.1 DEAD/DEAH box helicase [Fusobacterium sp.]
MPNFYQLLKLEDEFKIQVLNENKEIVQNYEDLDESDINIYIKTIQNDDFFISWDEKKKKDLVLDEDLLALLLKTKNFVTEDFKEISSKNIDEVYLIVTDDLKNNNEVNINIEVEDMYFFKNEVIGNFAYHEGVFYNLEIESNEFYKLEDLFVKIQKYELEGFLSLVLKNYKNLNIRYEDFETVEGSQKEAIPQMIIEKISLDNSLYMRINSIISTMDYDFFLEHKIDKIVTINELEKKIHISKINMKDLSENIEEILKVLARLQKKIHKKSMYYFDDEGLLILQEALAKEFVKKELLQLTAKYNIIGTDKLKKYNIRTVKPKIIGNFSYNIDYFEGNIEIDIDGEKFSIQKLLDSYRKDDYIVLSDGTNALINRKYIEKLQRVFKSEDENIKISFFDMPLVEELIENKIFSGEFVNRKDFFEGINYLDDYEEKLPNINASLRDYQKYGYKWLSYLVGNNLGACLADDMGLGKTLQAIVLLSKIHQKKDKKSIVIMPKSLIYNWENEILKFAPKLKAGIYYGTNRDLEIFNKVDIILTTYGTIRNDIEKFMEIYFDLIILDESQNIKNISSQTTKAVMLLKSKNRIALSGTPIENNLLELYSLFRFLNPSMFGTIQDFNDEYILPIQKYGDQEAIKELKKKIYPFILRRVKKEVLKDLPEKIEKVLYIDMNTEHKKYYEERRQYYYNILNENMKREGLEKNKFFILQALNELRHITSSPEVKNKKISSSKKEVLIENVVEAIENGHKVLIFVNYLSSIESICKSLEKNNIKYLKMTGQTKNRQQIVDRFQNNSRYKVFVMTLKTGGIGLNLTSADKIFIYDPWWNKTVENQAIDRAYRMGQDKTVFSYKLILKDSIEEKILKLQEMKSKLLEDLISADNLSTKNLSKSDIEFILGK